MADTEAENQTEPSRPVRWVVAGLSAVLVVTALAWAGGVQYELRWLIYREQFLALMLALTLGLAFLHVRADGGKGGAVPWYDAVAALVGLLAGGHVAVTYPTLSAELAYDPAKGIVLGGVLLLLIVEGLRRAAGTVLTGIVVVFLAYGLLAHLVPGKLAGRHVEPERLVTQLVLDTNGVLGTPLAIAATIVVVFVLFGHLLNRSGGAGFFTDLAIALVGRFRGGAAKIAIMASSLFGSISGSAVSNVATTGIITIPMMRRGGFPAAAAGGIEAVASTGGQLMPPIMGASAFLMAEFLAIGYDAVIVAALMPAVLYYVALFVQADLRAARDGIAAIDVDRIPPMLPVLKGGWFFTAPFAVLILALFVWNQNPDKAGLWAIGALLALVLAFGYRGKRPDAAALWSALTGAGTAVIDIVLITAAAGLIIGVLNESGLAFGLTLILVDLAQGNLAVLLVVAAAISIVLGMGMPTIGVYVLLAALVVPSLTKLGVAPIAAHLFVLYFGMMSMITPPVAIASYAAASLAEAPPMRTAWESVRFGWPAYVLPFLFVLSPNLILQGHPAAALSAAATAVAGVWLATVGIVGYFVRPLSAALRLAFAVAGLALLVPPVVGPWSLALNVGGALIGAALTAWELAGRRRRSRNEAPLA